MTTIPKEVKEIFNNPELVCNWQNYQVYCENYGKECPSIGMPEFLLYSNNSVRYANNEEMHAIFKTLPDD